MSMACPWLPWIRAAAVASIRLVQRWTSKHSVMDLDRGSWEIREIMVVFGCFCYCLQCHILWWITHDSQVASSHTSCPHKWPWLNPVSHKAKTKIKQQDINVRWEISGRKLMIVSHYIPGWHFGRSLRTKLNMTLNTWAFFVNIPDVQIMDVGYQDTLRELFLLFVVYFSSNIISFI